MNERSDGRIGTLRAMIALTRAKLLIAFVPFGHWRSLLGGLPSHSADRMSEAIYRASQVEWAAQRLPFATTCLPRAMALSWILRKDRIGHFLVFAARPAEQRDSRDALHAWVEIGGTRVIGDLPGPWLEILRLGSPN
jgi:hypothetical protein